jgi:hypothetical protein
MTKPPQLGRGANGSSAVWIAAVIQSNQGMRILADLHVPIRRTCEVRFLHHEKHMLAPQRGAFGAPGTASSARETAPLDTNAADSRREHLATNSGTQPKFRILPATEGGAALSRRSLRPSFSPLVLASRIRRRKKLQAISASMIR